MYKQITDNESYNEQIPSLQEQPQINHKPGFYTHDYKIYLEHIKIKDAPLISLNLAYDLTFLVQNSIRKLHHYSWTGVLIHEFQFENMITSIFMADSKTAIILMHQLVPLFQAKHEIVQLNLQTHEIITIPFKTQFNQISDLQIFNQTQMFCVKELKTDRKPLSDPKMKIVKNVKLTYLKYPFKKDKNCQINQKPIYVTYFNNQKEKIQTNIKILRLNNRSMVAIVRKEWLKDYNTQVYIFNPQKNLQKWQKYELELPLKPKAKTCAFLIDNIWQIQPSVLYVQIKAQPEASILGQKILKYTFKQLKQMQRSYGLIWNYQNPKKKQKVKLANLATTIPHIIHFYGQSLPVKFENDIKNYLQVKFIKQSQTRIFYYNYYEQYIEFDQEKYDQLRRQYPYHTHTYINYMQIDNKTLSTIQPIPLSSRIESVPYNMTKFLEYQKHYDELQDKHVLFVKLKILKQLNQSIKTIVVFMLDELIEGCDQDLMYFTACLVDDGDENNIIHHQIN